MPHRHCATQSLGTFTGIATANLALVAEALCPNLPTAMKDVKFKTEVALRHLQDMLQDDTACHAAVVTGFAMEGQDDNWGSATRLRSFFLSPSRP